MTPTEQQILDHLEGRNDRALQTEPISNNEWWLIEAVELLLRHQIELREELNELMTKELCRQITKEVFEELRNNGILR